MAPVKTNYAPITEAHDYELPDITIDGQTPFDEAQDYELPDIASNRRCCLSYVPVAQRNLIFMITFLLLLLAAGLATLLYTGSRGLGMKWHSTWHPRSAMRIGVANASCAVYGCVSYTPSNVCQCNSLCSQFHSCCPDYILKCTTSTTTSLLVLTSVGVQHKNKLVASCASYGCVDFIPTNACQCNNLCSQFHNCCPDHAVKCAKSSSTLVTTTSTTAVATTVAVMSMSTKNTSPCQTAVFGSECYNKVMWVMRVGIFQHPEWYPGINVLSDPGDVQAKLHEKHESNCARPCAPALDPSSVGPLLLAPGELNSTISEPLPQVADDLFAQVARVIAAPFVCNPAVEVAREVVIAAAKFFEPKNFSKASLVWQLPKSEKDLCFSRLKAMKVVVESDRTSNRNWCWVGLKEFGCHRHFYDHLTWADMQAQAVADGATSTQPFQPLQKPAVCDQQSLGGSRVWTLSEWKVARHWFQQNVAVCVLSLATSTKRRATSKARLDSLHIPFTFIDGVDMRELGALEAAKHEGLIPASFNFTRAQDEAYKPRQGMGTSGSIAGTVGCASGHFRAQRYGITHGRKHITMVLEDDVSPEVDIIPKLWQLVTKELPCDWQAVSLNSRCPFGTCISPHLTMVHPDKNEPAWRCHHGVNYGFQGMLYRTSEIESLQKQWIPVVFNESRPHCLDLDVALASISDKVRFYAVPAAQNPGFVHELPEGSSRVDINFQKMVEDVGK